MQAKLAKLRRELIEPSSGSGGGGKGEGEFYSLLYAENTICRKSLWAYANLTLAV